MKNENDTGICKHSARAEDLTRIISKIETHEELKIVNKLYRKRWYEIDKEKAMSFKKGDMIKWYKNKRANWGVIVEAVKKGSRYVKAISTKGSDWKLGGSTIEKVTDHKRILKMIEKLRAHGIEFKEELK